MRKLLVAHLMGFILLTPFPNALAFQEGIEEEALRANVEFLASDALQGREAGTKGDRIAESFVRASFLASGLSIPPGMKDYFQEFTALEAELDRSNTFVAIEEEGRKTYFRQDREIFYSLRGVHDVSVEASVVFAGFGISAPEYGYDDYSGVNVKGKIVLILNHEPGERKEGGKFKGRAPTRYTNPRVKAKIAKRHGALGVIIVNDEANGHDDIDKTLLRRYGSMMKKPFMSLEDAEEAIPLFYATRPVAKALLAGTGIDIVSLQKKIDEHIKPASRAIPQKRVFLNVMLAKVDKKHLSNVLGLVQGNDPKLKDEFIVIGAHHDHLGVGDKDEIYNGADDNASGTSGLIELAKVMATSPCGRSLLFVSFCGEEKGVLGSTYFSKHLPIDKLRVMINLDMIGRNNMDKQDNAGMFIVYTSAQTPFLEETVREEASKQKLDVRVAPYLNFRGASDHVIFHEMGVPVVFYFSGFHQDYHEPTDTAEKIVPAKIKKISEHVIGVLLQLGNAKESELLFDKSIIKERPRDKYERPY